LRKLAGVEILDVTGRLPEEVAEEIAARWLAEGSTGSTGADR
jgi:hypothetical protein